MTIFKITINAFILVFEFVSESYYFLLTLTVIHTEKKSIAKTHYRLQGQFFKHEEFVLGKYGGGK